MVTVDLAVEYAWCPGECGNKVRIIRNTVTGDRVSFCCVPCWNNFRDTYMSASEIRTEDRLPHSEQCDTRQGDRLTDEVNETEAFPFRALAKSPDLK